MTLREAILDALIDDDETILQISEYLNYIGLASNNNSIINELDNLYITGNITITFPENIKFLSLQSYANNDELWFKITEKGIIEWNKIK